ncbi:MAG: hypothetical protein ACUVWZ_10435 [Anaerolineae bacterium]
MQRIINHLRPGLTSRRTTSYLMALVSLLAVVALMGSLMGCDDCEGSTSTTQSSGQPPRLVMLDIQNLAGNLIDVTATAPGPPYPNKVRVTWWPPEGATNLQTNPPPTDCFRSSLCWWVLPVNPDTGKAEPVSVSYTPPPGLSEVTDTFEAEGWDTWYPPNHRSLTHKAWGPPAMASAGLLPARSPVARQDGYYRWRITTWVEAPGLALTADLCQDGVDLLQSDTAFIALRFPVQPPPLAETDPYTLPVSFDDGYLPYLSLLDMRSMPPTTILTTALEYKLWYLTFAENELPAAPGERWLALGAVTSPTITCAGLPELAAGQWEVRADVWLDLRAWARSCLSTTATRARLRRVSSWAAAPPRTRAGASPA